MSLSIIDRITSPPRPGFFWRDATGFPVESNNYNVWLGKVHNRLLATGGFVGDGWVEEAEDWFCRNSNVPCRDVTRAEPRERTFSDFLQFGNVAARHLDEGGTMVEPEEAERRAAICMTCPKNRPLAGLCTSCKAAEVASWIYRIIRGRSTSKDHSLQSCGVCGCSLTASVHLPLSAQKDERFPPADWPNHCWKRPKED